MQSRWALLPRKFQDSLLGYRILSPSSASKSGVSVFTTAGGMLNREDHDLLGSLVDHVIDEVAISGCDEFAKRPRHLVDDRSPEKVPDPEESAVLQL